MLVFVCAEYAGVTVIGLGWLLLYVWIVIDCLVWRLVFVVMVGSCGCCLSV